MKSALRAALFAVAWSGIARTAVADSVTLQNGAVYLGHIRAESKQSVTIVSDGVTWTFEREKVAALSHDAAEAARTSKARPRRSVRPPPAQPKAVTPPSPTAATPPPPAPPADGDAAKMQRLRQLMHQPGSMQQ